MTPDNNDELELLEMRLLLEGIYAKYGFDFRDYATPSLRRRIRLAMHSEGAASISGLQEKVLHDRACWRRVLLTLSVNVTSMFRDPEFFCGFREKVIPILRDQPFIRIWHTGCSTGEEVYSMAILMHEEGLYDRCRIYATDINEGVLRVAKVGIYSLPAMEIYERNYVNAGGQGALSDYYTAKYGNAIIRSSLRENVVFSQHNLATDRSFNEFNVILCRNVMIYFNKPLQNRAHELLYRSLAGQGVLGLGTKETIRYTPYEQHFTVLDSVHRIYQKVG